MLSAGHLLTEVVEPEAVDAVDVGPDRIPVHVFYPTESPESAVRLGPFDVSAAPGAPVRPGTYRLVVVSHGTGGTPLVHRALAAHLAREGFVVAALRHPGNHRDDDTLAGTVDILASRPRHVRAVVDHLLAAEPFAPHLVPGRVSLVGHSFGGYTALAAAGGRPTAFPHETGDGAPRPVEVEADGRVDALVLLAPATAWFLGAGALANVVVPILLLTAERDPFTPAWHGDVVTRGVADPRRVEHHVVPGAGHFAFQAPFPAAMAVPGFRPGEDPPGFDRAAYQPRLHHEVTAFLRAVST